MENCIKYIQDKICFKWNISVSVSELNNFQFSIFNFKNSIFKFKCCCEIKIFITSAGL